MDEYHLDLRQEDERANAELHSELEQKTRFALQQVWFAMQRGAILLTDSEWSALCFSAGFSPYDFNSGKGKR